MKNSFLRLAEDKRVDISPKDKHGRDKTIEAIVEEIYAFFARRERESLFIFDNAEEYKDIRRFLPSSLSLGCKKTYILITSRNKNWRIAESEGEIKTIQLGVFKEMEAVKFVKRALNIRDNLQDEEIKKLTQELQYFPLALGQAVAYINEKNIVLSYRGKEKIGVSDYLKKYEEEAEKLLDFESKYKSDRYTKTTFITWKITIDAIAQKECGSEALNVLEIMAYLAPDKIYIEEIFSKLVTNNEEKLWSAVELLDRYSIIDLKEGVANIHRLVQRVTELSLQKEGREEEVLRKALELISSDDLAQDSISHVASIWGYSSKHSRLIDDFYFSSSYTCRGVLFIRKNAPLHLLAANDDYEAISTIIPHIERHYPSKLREIVNVENNCGQTPLHIAAENGWLNIVKYLIDKDANINAKGEYGWTPLHIAAKNGKLDMIKYLTNKGANINAKDECYSTPLHLVAELGELSIVEYLINKGAYVDARDGWYRTPLFYAADSGKLGVAEYLVEKNANVNARDEYGSTPLYLATMKGKVDVVKILLKYDADVNAENNEGITVLYCATIGENLAVVEHLIERGANVNAKSKGIFFCGTPLHMAALRGNLEIVRHLVNKGADINAKNRYNETSLHYAAKNGSLKVVEYLVGKGICFDVSTEIGNTLLHFAVKSGRPEVVKYFVEKDIDVNVKNGNNETPLHTAVEDENLELTKYLIEKGANVNAKDKDGNTPLHLAAMKGKVDIAMVLLKHNANVNARTNWGMTVLGYAADDHQELVELLLAHGAAFY
ncbi:MAG: Phosphocholine transferase AnkX [Wolbachia endosymbiont of Ctenocephalides felis wCfeF]|nr:MAG: Phosphocholine transferase AnkX [Wolbachia endosymbiont of Ctenocephalides felis wCfeF]